MWLKFSDIVGVLESWIWLGCRGAVHQIPLHHIQNPGSGIPSWDFKARQNSLSPFLPTVPLIFGKAVKAHLLQHSPMLSLPGSSTGTRGSSADTQGCLRGRYLSGRSHWPPCFLRPGDPCTLIAESPRGGGGAAAYPGRRPAFNLIICLGWHPCCCCRRALGAAPRQQCRRCPFQGSL